METRAFAAGDDPSLLTAQTRKRMEALVADEAGVDPSSVRSPNHYQIPIAQLLVAPSCVLVQGIGSKYP